MQPQMHSYTSRLEALRPKYHAALAERREIALAYLSDSADSADPAVLRSEAHKTAGTAGSFGYEKLTVDAERLCRALDNDEDVHGLCRVYVDSIEAILAA